MFKAHQIERIVETNEPHTNGNHETKTTVELGHFEQNINSSQGETQQTDCVNYLNQLKDLKHDGQKLRADQNQPSLSQKPIWFDENLFENAKSTYSKHFMGANFAHLSGLLLLVRVDSIYKTLKATGKSASVSKLFQRYYHTLLHVKKWYEGNIFDENSDAYQSLLIVRGMHSKVSKNLNYTSSNVDLNHSKYSSNGSNAKDDVASKLVAEDLNCRALTSPKHISEYDIMITQFAFVGLIVTKAKHVGFLDDFSQKDLESLLHFWRVIGYYLGATDEYNLCSRKTNDTIGLCQAIIELEYKESIASNSINSEPGIMSVNIVRSLKFIPLLTNYGIMRYLYEILGIDSSEFESRQSTYSRISYTLIKLVMSRLLVYKALRSFNNGITRLSIYLVGKVEGWFANHLESKYGQELRL